MNIISKGIPPTERVYRAMCNSCKTVVEFKQSEGEMSDDQRDNFISVQCPVCPSKIYKKPGDYISPAGLAEAYYSK